MSKLRKLQSDPGVQAALYRLHGSISALRERIEKRRSLPVGSLQKAQERDAARAEAHALLDAVAALTGHALLHVGKASRPAPVQAPTSDDERARAFVASIPSISCGDTDRVASANLIKIILAAGPRRTLS